MNDAAGLLLESLGRTTLWLAAAGMMATLLLKLLRSQWPTAHRIAWLLVLLVGWTFVRLPVSVPWYAPQPTAPPTIEPPAATASEITAPEIAAPVIAAPVFDLAVEEPPAIIELAPELATAAPPLAVPSIAADPLVLDTATSLPLSTPLEMPPAAVVPASAQPARITIHWPAALIAGWILGMTLLASAWLLGYVRFVRLLRDRQPADDDSQTAWRQLLASAGVQRAIPLSVSQQFGPMLCCLPRGYELIVPAELWSELDGAGQGAILRHELAHYQRGDVWKSLAVRLLALPHWFNPVAWLAVRRFEEAAEWACDRAAIADEPATEYAKLLVHLGQSPHALGYGSSARGRSLAARVRRVLSGTDQEDTTMKKTVLLVAGLLMAATSVVQLDLVAKEPKTDLATEATEATEIKEDQPVPRDPTKDVAPVDEHAAPHSTAQQRAAQQRMIEHATKAYSAHLAAFEAQTVTMPPVYEWSLRWMQAAQAIAKNHAERIAAASQHVERMAELQKRTELLYQIGTKGGEAKDYAAANYYLAEAERHLAQLDAAQGNVAGGAAEAEFPPLQVAKSKPSAAAQRMVAQAKQVYENLRAQTIQNVPRETLVDWSLRWMQAAETAAENRTERIAAARGHIERMADLKKATDRLFELGSKGGSTSDVAAADYYLAEAERHLAEVEIPPSRLTELKLPSAMVDREMQVVDLEIKLAELRGQYSQAEVQLKTAGNNVAGIQRIITATPGTISRTELARAEGEVERLKAQLESLKEQIALHERKLALLKSLAKPQPKLNIEPQSSTPPQRRPGDPNAMPVLLYSGQDFDAWAEILRTDLSHEQKAEAVKALGAFGRHGYGRAATKEIIAAADREALYAPGVVHYEDLQSEVHNALSKIPREDAAPLIRAELKSEDVGQRIFAANMLWVTELPDEVVKLLTPLLDDPSTAVRRTAAVSLVQKAPQTPGLFEVLREWLSPDEKQDSSQMAIATVARAPQELQTRLAPDLVRLLDRETTGMGGPFGGGMGMLLPPNASPLLKGLGPAAIPALEEGAKSDNEVIRQKSLNLLKTLREQPPPADAPEAEK
ncbi:MAG: M56 family metallopeptidase [Pirellulales bacterium]